MNVWNLGWGMAPVRARRENQTDTSLARIKTVYYKLKSWIARTKTAYLETMELSLEQRRCVELAESENCFFTGEAGTGKSLLLGEINREAINTHGHEKVFVTAPTGRAAKNIGGTTVHAFAGIGLGNSSCYKLLKTVQSNNGALERWKSCQTLIIDEVSMLSLPLFEKLEFLGRNIRGINAPFGNIQLLLFGDFYQLPPVPEDGQQDVQYCFQSPLWDVMIQKNVELTQVYRQTEPDI